jgi:hypothetical protein
VNPLNGPPTTWLAQVMTNACVAESYVPDSGVVSPGRDPSGFGEPWLN